MIDLHKIRFVINTAVSGARPHEQARVKIPVESVTTLVDMVEKQQAEYHKLYVRSEKLLREKDAEIERLREECTSCRATSASDGGG